MEPQDTLTSDDQAQSSMSPLIRTLGPATVVYVFFIVLAVLSSILFVYQFLFADSAMARLQYEAVPVDPLHVWGHALRAAIGVLLAISLRRYLAAIRALRRHEDGAESRVFVSIARWWNSLATSAVLGVAFGVFAVMMPQYSDFRDLEFERFTPADVPEVSIELCLAQFEPDDELREFALPETGELIWLHLTPVITNADIAEASVVIEPDGSPSVRVDFTAEGEAAIRVATKQHMDRPLAIIVDGQIVSAPIIRWEIGASATISDLGTLSEVRQIARSLSGRK